MNAEKTGKELSKRELEIMLKETLSQIKAPDPDNILRKVQDKLQADTLKNSCEN